MRITAQLTEPATGHNLWANNYDRDLSDVLTLQEEVARAIANEIRVTVTPEEIFARYGLDANGKPVTS